MANNPLKIAFVRKSKKTLDAERVERVARLAEMFVANHKKRMLKKINK